MDRSSPHRIVKSNDSSPRASAYTKQFVFMCEPVSITDKLDASMGSHGQRDGRIECAKAHLACMNRCVSINSQ